MRRVDEKISSPLRTAIITLFVGVAVGAVASHSLWGTRSASTISASSSDRMADGSEQLYTCGMHPNVMQKGPGICPICNMKLTPLKADQGSATGEASKERKILYWRAPMDPNYISDKPGRSPMGMGLVPVYADEESSS
jgi:Cu(I)/Ag(I) efflux system membrane fusion protein/cobalt-zinc-cadmium efflux system membrane fusion protein